MSQLIEFLGNHLLMFSALMIVATLIIKVELENRLSKVKQVNPAEAVRLMNDESLVVLDTREDQEFSSGHIKGALNIPMSQMKKRIAELDKYKSRPVLLYCRSGSRSNYTGKLLSKAGFDNVQNLAGGIMAWSTANMPVTKK
jgi:rhodanese-related sulfurtransferase